jgi:exopolyphosphatase/guanosine-5'-triphosphate,3'-diphosphate pyrophosphatase
MPANPESSAKPSAPGVAAAGQPRPVAVIDVGTRAIRLDVAEIRPDGQMRILESLQRASSLGKDTFAEGRIDPASIEEGVDILRDYRHVMQEYGITAPDQIRAVATSSVREAGNKDAFLDRLYIATGINVEVLEDAEVEHLIYLALHDLFEQEPVLQRGNVLVAEVGGGSTRLLLIQDGYVTYSGSFRLGALRLREVLEAEQTPTDRICAVLDHHIQRIINQMRQSVPAADVPCLIALAGDTETAMSRLLPGWGPDAKARIRVGTSRLAETVVSTPPEQLMRRHHLPSQEAETAGQSLLVYDRMARAFGVREMLVTAKSMRRGLLMRMAAVPGATARFAEQLAHSAILLGQRYHFDERHARHVTDLSLRLFRELQAEHHLGVYHEMLLRTAGILHDIGAFVSNASHHKHSMYLIQNSELFGLTRRDTLFVALIARYHRRSPPRATHIEYMALDRDGRTAVAKLAALLRVADALDRSHLQYVRTLSFARADHQFVITVNDVDDVTLERTALREKGDLFASVYGLQVVLRTAQTLQGSVFNG